MDYIQMDTIQAYSSCIYSGLFQLYTMKSLAKRQATFIFKRQLNYTFLGNVEWKKEEKPQRNVNRQCKYRVDLLFPIQFSGNKMKKTVNYFAML